MISEFHTSDLTGNCLRAVQLRHDGQVIGKTETALYRGSLFHEAVSVAYAAKWDGKPESFMALGAAKVDAEAKRDNRPVTDAVLAAMVDLRTECVELLKWYKERFVSPDDKVIGVELPIRMTLEVDGEPVEFASHLDLLRRTKDGILTLRDFKTGEDDPTGPYLARNLQLGMYAMAIRHGSIQVDGEWIEFGEWPLVEWFHVNSLLPYKRKTTDKETGEVLPAGSHRPVDKIVRVAPIDESKERVIRDEFALRVRMWRAGHFPTNPDPVGCLICQSRHACPHFTEPTNV